MMKHPKPRRKLDISKVLSGEMPKKKTRRTKHRKRRENSNQEERETPPSAQSSSASLSVQLSESFPRPLGDLEMGRPDSARQSNCWTTAAVENHVRMIQIILTGLCAICCALVLIPYILIPSDSNVKLPNWGTWSLVGVGIFSIIFGIIWRLCIWKHHRQ